MCVRFWDVGWGEVLEFGQNSQMEQEQDPDMELGEDLSPKRGFIQNVPQLLIWTALYEGASGSLQRADILRRAHGCMDEPLGPRSNPDLAIANSGR